MTAVVENLAVQNVGPVDQVSALREEAEALATHLRTQPRAALVPREGGGWRVYTLKEVCRGSAFGVGKLDGHTEIGTELLEALRSVEDRRSLLIPGIQSTAIGRHVRAGIILPRGFDVYRSEPYPVVSLIPPRDKSYGIGAAVVDDRLLERIEPVLEEAGLQDAVLVMHDVLYDFVDRRETKTSYIENWYRWALDEDILPYVAARFRTAAYESASFLLPGLARANVASKHQGVDSPLSVDVFESVYSKGGWTNPSGPRHEAALRDRFLSIRDPIVVPRPGGYAIERAGTWERWGRWKGEGAPPPREILEGLSGHADPTTLFARVGRSKQDPAQYVVLLPPAFDLGRPHELVVVLAAEGAASEIGRELLLSGDLPKDAIALIPSHTAFPGLAPDALKTALEELAFEAILPVLSERSTIAFSKCSVVEVAFREVEESNDDGSPPSIKKVPSIDRRPGSRAEAHNPYYSLNGAWVQAPTRTMRGPFPAANPVEHTETIPAEFLCQPETRGSLFVPVFHSNALGKDLRVGVYLPPTYDPHAPELHPVLFLLPGRNNPLHFWTEKGGLVAKLDQMMSGDAQKMIVVIPDGIDSYYVNTPPGSSAPDGQSKVRAQDAQDFVVRELVTWATTAFRGDFTRLSVGGISLGGFGAMLAVGMNPGLFRSVSAHSGLVGSQRFAGQHDCSDIAHPPGGPNATRLVVRGAFDASRPKIYVDVGSKDASCWEDSVELSGALRARGIDHELRVFGSESDAGARKHDWDHWGSLLEHWVAFHQSAHGTPGQPRQPMPLDVTRQTVDGFIAQQREKWAAQSALTQGLQKGIAQLERAREVVLREVNAPPSHRDGDRRRGVTTLFNETLTTSETLIEECRRVLRISEDGVCHAEHLDLFKRTTEQLKAQRSGLVEISKERALWENLEPEFAAGILSVIRSLPETRHALLNLVSARPELFRGKDRMTSENFAACLAGHVKRGFVGPEDVSDLVEFLTRINTNAWSYRKDGYSHSTALAMMLVWQHPGLILRLIEAAKEDRPYSVHLAYDSDTTLDLPPLEDFKTGLRSVPGPPGTAVFPAYERGLVGALVDSLRPTQLPPDRLAERCDAVAIAYHKLTGQELRYAWAFNLQDGDDLYLALESQNGEGLGMADVDVCLAKDGWRHYHFPIFYGYDPETDTVAVSDFAKGMHRVPLAGMVFKCSPEGGPALYYRPCPAIEPLLTPDLQQQRVEQKRAEKKT